jgi:hypothetical protein
MARAGKVKAPVRQKKSDRLTHPKVSEAEQIIDYTIAPLQRAIQQADERWGIDMLPELVSPESAAKWGLCMARLNEAIDKHDVEGATQWVGASLRGLGHMEADAVKLGASRAPEGVFEVEDGSGNIFAIMEDGRSWQSIQKSMPERKLLTRREAAVAIAFYQQHALGIMVDEIKQHFPKAEVLGVTKDDDLNDEINFL